MINFANVLAHAKKTKEEMEIGMAAAPKDRRELAKISRQHSQANDIIEIIEKYDALMSELADLKTLLQDENDEEVRSMVREEVSKVTAKSEMLSIEIQDLLLSKDGDDSKDIILEIRAGTGGDEAALFATKLFRMYARYAAKRRWKFDIMHISENGIGGYKEARAEICGKDIYANMKYESGVHRVQRVPETESGGRLHTSTATVAILPEVEDVEVHIDEKDLKIDVYRASGPGGQSVNTTDSAVRVTHLPTNTVVIQQDEKSQHKNKAKAIKVLKARLHHMYAQKQHDEISKNRKQQIGDGDRSERIRTYNFPQSRITDHRNNFTVHNITEVVEEGNLDALHQELKSYFFHKEFDEVLGIRDDDK